MVWPGRTQVVNFVLLFKVSVFNLGFRHLGRDPGRYWTNRLRFKLSQNYGNPHLMANILFGIKELVGKSNFLLISGERNRKSAHSLKNFRMNEISNEKLKGFICFNHCCFCISGSLSSPLSRNKLKIRTEFLC